MPRLLPLPSGALLALLALFALRLPAAESRPFDLAADTAERSLRAFSKETGVPVVFPSEIAQAVRTPAVRGRYTVREALDRLLAGTGLKATQDEQSGGFLVERGAPVPNAPRAARPESRDRPVPTQNSAIAASPAAEEVLTLNPFVISADDNVGYSANSTLSGSRLNTALRDVGASVSIITPEFLADTASTNIGELLSLTTSTEVGGISGNFAGGDQLSGRPDQSESRENPAGNQRVRGIGPATNTRDYFITDIPFDSYNTSRVTINRGPNSLLFGIGNPAGIIEASTNHPNLRRDRTEIGTRYGSEDSYRATADLNRVLVKDRLAFRLSTVSEQNNFQQKPAFDRKRRGSGSLELVLRDGKAPSWFGRTSARFSGEIGDSQSTPVNVIPSVTSMGIFFDVPNPAIDDIPGVILDPRLKRGTSTFTWAPKVTVDNRVSAVDLVAQYPGITRPYFIQIPLIYDTPGQSAPGYKNTNNPALANLAGVMGRVRYAPNPNNRQTIDAFATGPNNYLAGFVGTTLQDRRIFDYREHLISGGTNHVEQTFQVGNVALTQELLNGRAGVEVAYDQQKTQSHRSLPFSFGDNGGGSPGSSIAIDVSQYLSNDQPNPNVGRPFIQQSGGFDRIQQRGRESFRATAFYKLNLEEQGRKLFGVPLGNHVFTALHNTQRIDVFSRAYSLTYRSKIRNAAVDIFGVNASSATTYPVIIKYVGPSVLGANSLSDVRITDYNAAPLPKDGDVFDATFFDFTGKRLVTEPVYVQSFISGGSKARQLVDSQSLSLKSDFFRDTLVSVVGWRWDGLKTFSSEGNLRLPDDTLDISGTRLKAAPDLDERGHNFTWSLVGRLPKKISAKLPLGMELGAYYNASGNFNPVNVRTNLKGEIIPAPAGNTKEYGFLVEFFERRASLRLNWFETTQTNSTNGAQGATANLYAFASDLTGRYLGAQSQGLAFNSIAGVTAAGYTSYEQLYAAFQQILPEPTRTLNNLRVIGLGQRTDSIQGLTDTTNLNARGFEAELVGNLTRRWRVSFNVAKQETVLDGSARLTKQIADAAYANLERLKLLGIDQAPTLPQRDPISSYFASRVTSPLASTTARDGAASQEQRRWRANFVSSYSLAGFENRFLKAMTVGTAVRWQAKIAIGNPFLTGERLKQRIVETDKTYTSTSQIKDTDAVMQQQFPDLANPFYGPEELAGDFWVGYRRKIFRNIDWHLQLNVRNAWGNRDDIPVTANPDGTIAVIRIPNETRWTLSSTFIF